MSDFSFGGSLLDNALADAQGRIPGDPLYNTGTPIVRPSFDPDYVTPLPGIISSPGDEPPLRTAEEYARISNVPITSMDVTRLLAYQAQNPTMFRAPTVSQGVGSSTNTFVPAADARNTISQVLANYGLSSLASYLYDVYAREEVNIRNPDALLYAIKDQPAYQARFAGNVTRKKKGLAELAPATYIGLEDSYRQILQANGLPPGFYDSLDDFRAFIENDKSPAEVQRQIEDGFNEVDRANPEVLRQIRLLYPESGIADSRESLAAFFLDPVKAAPLLERQAKAAKIGAKAFETGGIQLTAAAAEDIAARGYSDAAVASAFQDLSMQAGLLTEIEGEAALTQQEKIGAVFGYNTAAAKKVGRRRESRKAIFESGGRFTATSGATSGTQESALGYAQ